MHPQSARYNILLVDDLPQNIQVAANILQCDDYVLFFATSGASALEKIEATPFDVILLDVMMPDMNGFEVCARIRSNPRCQHIPIIFLTAKTDMDSVVKGFEVGATDYITKPFYRAELLARVRTHLEFHRIQGQLYELNATKDKFFAIIAHDLRAPFTTLLGLTEILDTELAAFTAEELRQVIGNLRKSTQKTYTLLENLLTWSRLQRGMMMAQPEILPLRSLVNTCLLLSSAQAARKQIALDNCIPENIEVYADRMMLDTILRNLISNAVKFTHPGGAVTLTAQPGSEGVEIAVSDSGAGISQDEQTALFRIDLKHSKTGTAGEEGSGLGLILCKDLVEKNRGQIRVESAPGHGTTVYVTLPPVEPGKAAPGFETG